MNDKMDLGTCKGVGTNPYLEHYVAFLQPLEVRFPWASRKEGTLLEKYGSGGQDQPNRRKVGVVAFQQSCTQNLG